MLQAGYVAVACYSKAVTQQLAFYDALLSLYLSRCFITAHMIEQCVFLYVLSLLLLLLLLLLRLLRLIYSSHTHHDCIPLCLIHTSFLPTI